MPPPSFNYDVVIVGAGIAGCSFAHSLAARSQKPLRICLLERSLAEPDRIVGELLQPRGVEVLKSMGMEECLEGIDAVPAHGYCVVSEGKNVHIPYPKGYQGRSFHHGKFIMALRSKAKVAPGVDVLERTVAKLIECPYTGKVLGVRVVNKTGGSVDGVEEEFYGDLTVVADGCFSNFRAKVMGDGAAKAELTSHFVGLILEDARLPYDEHGTVVLIKGHGPVLLYRISKTETRMLVAVRVPLPQDLKVWLLIQSFTLSTC
jgi:squalene monooxygenase